MLLRRIALVRVAAAGVPTCTPVEPPSTTTESAVSTPDVTRRPVLHDETFSREIECAADSCCHKP